jgi:hypothetical protein
MLAVQNIFLDRGYNGYSEATKTIPCENAISSKRYKGSAMQNPEIRCSKCGGEMEYGFLIDTVYPGSAVEERQGENLLWTKGSRANIPRPGFFSRLIGGIGFQFSRVEKKPVTALRCVQCGYLDLYAR